MANDFSNDIHCKALWSFEVGDRYADSIGGNTLTGINTPLVSTTYHKELDWSAFLSVADQDGFYIDDGDLDAGFPLKSGDTNKVFSMCFWIYIYANPGANPFYVFAKYDTTAPGRRSFVIDILGGFLLNVIIGYNDGANYIDLCTTDALTEDQWYHVGFVYNDNTGTYLLRVWDDVAEEIVENISGTSPQNINIEDAPLYIGQRMDSARFSSIYLDELTIFDDELYNEEIDAIRKQVYTQPIKGEWVRDLYA